MEKIFLVHGKQEYTYQDLIIDLNNMEFSSPFLYVVGNDPYKIFLSIIHSLVHGYSIEILDGDFSENELEGIGFNSELLSISRKSEEKLKIVDFKHLLKLINKEKNWESILYTSGTSGRPKKVSHTLKTLTRNVKSLANFKEDIWAFAYNPTHMAGIQVFFQALINQNTMIYTFDGQQRYLPNLIEKYKITNISATSTYYRSVLPYFKNSQFESIKRITFGGEKYDSNMENIIKSIFPNARIRNIYASTEAGSLFAASVDIFTIPENIRELVKISSNNELLLHQSLLGHSESFSLEEDWFKTGDLVEQLDSYSFKFKSRTSDIINVGGYKVNPLEVENTLIKVPGVIDLLVKSRENRVTGHILVIDVVKDENADDMELKKSIKKFASEHLQEWKIPRIIKFVEDIPRTRTGKKVRI
ncbi:AMP-binding protein [Paenibacillus sp. HWE-109]|uniref:AMP-binding protein n=1 Tax=Paenibacillus sp. HWE-109 TaxID=1306526 RepID=UPI001EE0C2D3|nr:AMP-binding protein [Paenibacillus sp. HWE-109]UKS25973.1 AMP-binding protein [Paenibacillus sp. HWE-109]